MAVYRYPNRQTGLSMVELAVVMVVVGILGIMIWRWMETTRQPEQRSAILAQLAEAQAAVEGFVLARHRLPCAAADEGGHEACGNTTTAVFLPWRDLGLSSRFRALHYGVNRGGGLDLAVLPPAMIAPDLHASLNIDYGAEVPSIADARVSAALAAARNRRDTVNGLDWCRVSRKLAASPGAAGVLEAGNSSASIPVAYVLAHPGQNRIFEGQNVIGAAGWRFDFPGRVQSVDYDDVVLAVGPAELSARMGCPARLEGMLAAAQAAYTAYDNARAVQKYWLLREFDVTQAESAVTGAESGLALAALNAALAGASLARSIASASNTEGITIFGIALATASTVLAATELVLAGIDLQSSIESLADAKDKRDAAQNYLTQQVYAAFAQALETAVLLDQKGLNP